jgi:competence protein ComEA
MSRTHLAAALAVLVAAAIGISRMGASGAPEAAAVPPPAIRVDAAEPEVVLVHVAGAVRHPGVYRLKAGERIDDAVHRAGGATRRADLAGVNLAAKVQDGRQVLVPERAPRIRTGGAAGAGEVASPSAAAPDAPVNLNTATLEQLDTLDGVGPATAKKIIDFREANGGFGSVEELGEVPGIGEKRMAALREAVTV